MDFEMKRILKSVLNLNFVPKGFFNFQGINIHRGNSNVYIG